MVGGTRGTKGSSIGDTGIIWLDQIWLYAPIEVLVAMKRMVDWRDQKWKKIIEQK